MRRRARPAPTTCCVAACPLLWLVPLGGILTPVNVTYPLGVCKPFGVALCTVVSEDWVELDRSAPGEHGQALLGCLATVATGRCLTPAGETVEEVGSHREEGARSGAARPRGLLIWRKVQADRAELDLWTEATGSEN
ncbi:DLW-39 family protein [Nonomuraea recticatena]